MDPCPELTDEQVNLQGLDYGDKTLKLPCGPLPWPTGRPEPGYVSKTNPRRAMDHDSGGQATFIGHQELHVGSCRGDKI